MTHHAYAPRLGSGGHAGHPKGHAMNTYSTLAAYTADVVAARDAYAEDEAVRAGLCCVCKDRKRDGKHRRCWTCQADTRARRKRTP